MSHDKIDGDPGDSPSNYGFVAKGRLMRVCLPCGVVVADPRRHDRFHADLAKLQRQVKELREQAKRGNK